MLKYYAGGVIALFVFCLICGLFTKKWFPWQLAKGDPTNNQNWNYSASLLQMIIFTMLTVFAYATVFTARYFEHNGAGLLPSLKDENTWLNVPTNLLMLMGVSVGTAVASRAIKVTQQENGGLPETDNSSLTTYRDGRTDLVKIQMLIWTVIAVIVYLGILWRFMTNECFNLASLPPCSKDCSNSLPDIDTAFLVLLGISQAGQVVNQLSEGSTAASPVIAKISIAPESLALTTGAPTGELQAMSTDAQNKAIPNLPDSGLEWKSDNSAVAGVDANGLVTWKSKGDCNITAKAKLVTSNLCKVKCS